MDCPIDQRSARGYCPGEEGHAEEVCGTHELSGIPCEVQDGEPVFVESTEVPAELPHTGVDPVFGLLGTASLLVGVVVLRLGGQDRYTR